MKCTKLQLQHNHRHFFRSISPNVKSVFVYLQRDKLNDTNTNPYEFNTSNINANRNSAPSLSSCR